MKRLLFTALILLSVSTSFSQNYKASVGLRFSTYVSISGKYFFDKPNALEIQLSGLNNGIGLCGLYERHLALKEVKNMFFFFGGGAHAAFFKGGYAIGGDGVAGFDYNFETVPINLSIDWKPSLTLVKHVGSDLFNVGISARFSF